VRSIKVLIILYFFIAIFFIGACGYLSYVSVQTGFSFFDNKNLNQILKSQEQKVLGLDSKAEEVIKLRKLIDKHKFLQSDIRRELSDVLDKAGIIVSNFSAENIQNTDPLYGGALKINIEGRTKKSLAETLFKLSSNQKVFGILNLEASPVIPYIDVLERIRSFSGRNNQGLQQLINSLKQESLADSKGVNLKLKLLVLTEQ